MLHASRKYLPSKSPKASRVEGGRVFPGTVARSLLLSPSACTRPMPGAQINGLITFTAEKLEMLRRFK